MGQQMLCMHECFCEVREKAVWSKMIHTAASLGPRQAIRYARQSHYLGSTLGGGTEGRESII